MSNDKPVNSPTTLAEVPAADSTETKRPNIGVRAYRRIRNTQPKTAIAVVGGVLLVAGGAFLGRKTAPYHVEIVEEDLELENLVILTDNSEDSVA